MRSERMTHRLLTLISLLVLVDFTKSGASQKPQANISDDEATKRTQEMNTKLKKDNDRLRHQLEIKDLEIIKKNQEMEVMESAAANLKTTSEFWKDEALRMTEWLKRKEKSLGLKYLEFQERAAIQKEGMESRIQMLTEELLKQKRKDNEMTEMKRRLEASERLRAKCVHDKDLLKKIVESKSKETADLHLNVWKPSQSDEAKRQSCSVREITSRGEVEKEQLETRIQIMAEQLSGRILDHQLMEIQLKSNDILRRQLAETKQNICLPDSPTHGQVGGTCMNYATATWIRKTLTEQFLRDLPRHHEIVEALPWPKFQIKTWREGLESIKKEAERWNLEMELLDLSKEGIFDRVHKLLVDRHPLLLNLRLQNWGPVKRHVKESQSEYLKLQEWDTSEYLNDDGSGHCVVVTEYIPPQHGKPALYKMKNSHGEQGGSFGQKGYILIEDKVLRAMKVTDALIARKIEWNEEAMRLKSQIHKLNEHLSFYRNLATAKEYSKGMQKLEMSKVMESMTMEAKRNIENLKKQLAEAKQSVSLPDNPVQKHCDATSMSVAMSIWTESNKSFWKGIEHGNLRIRNTAFPKKGDFGRAHNFLKLGYPLLLRFKRGEWDVIQNYIDESSREYLGPDDWEIMKYQKEGDALVVTEYIEPMDGKPGLYKIKTSHGEHAGEPGQKEYILIEEKMLRDFDLASVSVEMPYMEFRDIERGGGK